MSFPFFFNDSATTDIYTLSLHDALPISCLIATIPRGGSQRDAWAFIEKSKSWIQKQLDRKSTRLNSSHLGISYAVLCLKKKRTKTSGRTPRRPRSTRQRAPSTASRTT